MSSTPNVTPTPMPVFSPLERPCDVGASVAEEELPVLKVPVLEVPVLELPVLELPVLELPVLELAVEEEFWLVIVDDGREMEVELESEVLGCVVVIVEWEVGSADVKCDDAVVEAGDKFGADPVPVM
jgi:hypothetical protein